MADGDRVVWTPTAPELSAGIRAAVFTVFRRDLVVLSCVYLAFGLMVALAIGPALAGVLVGFSYLLVAAFFLFVTYRRNARVFRAAYPVGVEASAEATDAGLHLISAVSEVQLPWSRLARPRVGTSIVAFRDTLTRRPTAIPRQLFRDEWLSRLAPASS